MKTMPTITEARNLLEKYYEGWTSIAEEEALHLFLSQEGLPSEFDADRALFGYFASQKKVHSDAGISMLSPVETNLKSRLPESPSLSLRFNRSIVLRWSFAAAALISGVLVLNLLFGPQTRNYAYIDGVRVTDTETLRSQAQASIDQLTAGPDEVEASTNGLEELYQSMAH